MFESECQSIIYVKFKSQLMTWKTKSEISSVRLLGSALTGRHVTKKKVTVESSGRV